jgi:HK97 gp10 family phage protein
MKHVTGMEDLVKEFEKAGVALDKEIKPVLKKNGKVILDSMKSLCNVNTGCLRNSIGFLNPDNPKFPNTIVIGPDFSKGGTKKSVGGVGNLTIAALANIAEYGAAPSKPNARRNKSNKPFRRVLINGKWLTMTNDNFGPKAAKPFIRPALLQNESKVVNGIIADLSKILNEKTKNLQK